MSVGQLDGSSELSGGSLCLWLVVGWGGGLLILVGFSHVAMGLDNWGFLLHACLLYSFRGWDCVLTMTSEKQDWKQITKCPFKPLLPSVSLLSHWLKWSKSLDVAQYQTGKTVQNYKVKCLSMRGGTINVSNSQHQWNIFSVKYMQMDWWFLDSFKSNQCQIYLSVLIISVFRVVS